MADVALLANLPGGLARLVQSHNLMPGLLVEMARMTGIGHHGLLPLDVSVPHRTVQHSTANPCSRTVTTPRAHARRVPRPRWRPSPRPEPTWATPGAHASSTKPSESDRFASRQPFTHRCTDEYEPSKPCPHGQTVVHTPGRAAAACPACRDRRAASHPRSGRTARPGSCTGRCASRARGRNPPYPRIMRQCSARPRVVWPSRNATGPPSHISRYPPLDGHRYRHSFPPENLENG
jgi:hypothetical protein